MFKKKNDKKFLKKIKNKNTKKMPRKKIPADTIIEDDENSEMVSGEENFKFSILELRLNLISFLFNIWNYNTCIRRYIKY